MQTIRELMEEQERIKVAQAALDERKKVNTEALAALVAEKVAAVRKAQGKEFGVAMAVVDGFEVKETIPKSVSWDPAKMRDIFDSIKAHDDDPFKYIEVKMSVSEKNFGGFSSVIQAVFAPARIVKAGKPTYEFKEVG